jgi:hypothetical protein
MSSRLDWDKAKSQPRGKAKPQPLKKTKATDKQRSFILSLIPDFPRKSLLNLTISEASTIIDVRLGKKMSEKKGTPRKTNFTSTQAKACKKHGVSDEVRVTLLRDRLIPGVRTRRDCAAAREGIPSE